VGWRSTLAIVQPATVLAWHRQGFRLFWRWKSRPNPVGRPRLDAELRDLIRRMARENPTWGRRRIRAELALLGYAVAELTVATQAPDVAAASPTGGFSCHACLRSSPSTSSWSPTFHLLFVFIVRGTPPRTHLRQRHGSSRPTGPPTIEAFPEETAPKYLLRDRDAIYGEICTRCVHTMGIRQVITAPRAPWQNPFVERVIGSIRRECLDHFLILNETHLYRLLRAYVAYYNAVRPHQALDNNSPQPRNIDPPPGGRIIAFPQVGGLHHRYQRAA
jgi:hypothetical protein